LNRASFAVSLVAVACLANGSAGAFLVGLAPTFDELVRQADFIGKVTVLDSKPVVDPWFDGVRGYAPVQTQLEVLATYKGDAAIAEIAFRHFADGEPQQYFPQTYDLERGRTYVVFAAATNERAVFRQLWKAERIGGDKAVVLAASTEPRNGEAVKSIVFAELTGLLKSATTADVLYGLAHLERLTGVSGDMLLRRAELDPSEVLTRVVPLLSSPDNEVVLAAAKMIGSNNPYMAADDAQRWLVPDERPRVPVPGFATKEGARPNPGGKLYWKQLVAVADRPGAAKTRAFAIRALGHAEEPAILPHVLGWTRDAEPLVRQSAAVLLADFTAETATEPLARLAADPQPEARIGAAHAVGFGQFSELIPLLGRMLGDSSPAVQSAAAMSLLSFSPRDSVDVLRANIDNREFHALFVNALARDDTAGYVDELGEIIKKQKSPEHFWGGAIPWTVSWLRLFFYVQGQPVEQVRDGRFDKVLDMLEYPASGHAAGPRYTSSSEPVDLYALYVQRGMADRAAKLRVLTKQNVVGDLHEFYDRVDQNPQSFQRQ
jgi:hypothetical protein